MGFIKGIFNAVADPRLFFLLAVAAAGRAGLEAREDRVERGRLRPARASWRVFFIFGIFDPNFRLIVTKPDNVPIVGLIFLLVFFVWYSMREAVLNDRRIAAGQGPIEKEESDRVWVWPDLVYTELISLILCSVVLIVWSIFLKAPLEQPANPANTPNPSKAPWYFLGPAGNAGLLRPVAGRRRAAGPDHRRADRAFPYIDKNPKGNGYYTFNERKAEITIFLFGFVVSGPRSSCSARSCAGRTGTSSGRSSSGTSTSSRR